MRVTYECQDKEVVMMWRMVPMLFVVALTATSQVADAAQRCERLQVSSRTIAGTPQQRAPQMPSVATALMGLALLATGAVTRRSTIERA